MLRRQVLTGAFTGGVLPPEDSLAREFGASRNAVRDALATLRAEGLVARIQGVGTLVAAEKYPHGLHRLLGLAETLREHGEVVNEVPRPGWSSRRQPSPTGWSCHPGPAASSTSSGCGG